MTHTKEPWKPCKAFEEDGAFNEDGETVAWSADIECDQGNATAAYVFGRSKADAEAKAERVAALWNALANIPDPAAFVEAARELGCAASHATSGNTMALYRLSATLEAFRATLGEGGHD